jgi:hypothetical protein
MKNLMQTGALTIPPPVLYEGEDNAASKGKNRYLDPRHKPRITALGKIFVNLPVDLKITRIFLFGMALKCMRQAIYIGCIHAQTRSVFRKNARNADPVNIAKL